MPITSVYQARAEFSNIRVRVRHARTYGALRVLQRRAKKIARENTKRGVSPDIKRAVRTEYKETEKVIKQQRARI